MKKILSILAFLVSISQAGWTQQLNQYKYGHFDNYLTNPAYVGNNNYYTVLIGSDVKFSGLEDASPKTFILSAHSKVGKGYLFEKDGKINKFFSKFGNAAFGFQALYYNFGPQNEYNFGLTYGYHLKLSPNVYTKRPRQLVFAFTPRLFVLSFNRNQILDSDNNVIVDYGNDPVLPNDLDDKFSHANFKADVGVLYQNIFYDIGVSWLNITNAKIGFENNDIIYGVEETIINDSLSTFSDGYQIYDSVYSSQIVLNGKLKFLNVYETERFDVNFIPDLTFIYKPNSRDFELFANLSLDWNFYEPITTVRKELKYNIKSGMNISYTQRYDKLLIQPYLAFDFMNFTLQYTYQYNGKIDAPGYWGGNQISFIYALGRDKVIRTVDNKTYWKN